MKLVLDVVTNTDMLTTINQNFTDVVAELQNKVLYRDNPIGEVNTVQNDVDHNGNDIINVNEGRFTQLYQNGVPIQNLITGDSTAEAIAAANAAALSATQANNSAIAAGVSAGQAQTSANNAAASAANAAAAAAAAVVPVTNALNAYKADVLSTSDVAKGTALIGFKSTYTGGVGRLLNSHLADVVTIKDFGAVGDGVANDDGARVLSQATGVLIYYPTGTYIMSAQPDVTRAWGPGKVYVAGNRVYMRPSPEPIREVYAELMDVPTNNATDCYAPLQRAIDYCQANNYKLVLPRNANLKTSQRLVIKQGGDMAATSFFHFEMEGNRAFIGHSGADFAIEIQPQCLTANKTTGRGQGVIYLRNFTVTGQYNAGAKAIQWGRTGYFAYDLLHSRMEDVTFSGFNANSVFTIQGFGNVIFKNITGEVGSGMAINTLANSDFTGDLIFEGCQFQGTASVNPILFAATTGSGLAELRGVKFKECNIYDGIVAATAGTNGAIADIWFVDCGLSFEGSAAVERRGHEWNCAATGQVYNITYRDNYFAGWKGTALRFNGNPGAVMLGIVVQGNTFGFNNATFSTPPCVVHVNGFASAIIQGNQFHGNTCTQLIYCQDARGFTVQGNRNRDGTHTNFVAVGGTSENFIITDNAGFMSGAAVNDFSSGSVKITTGNLVFTTQ